MKQVPDVRCAKAPNKFLRWAWHQLRHLVRKIFFKRSQKINKPPHELHHMSVMTAYPQNIAA